jgi:RNA polymerase sigma factor (sigma-70 family)
LETPNTNINQLTDHLFRHESGKMVAVITRIFGLPNIEMAEDVVQEAFAQAVKEWRLQVPANPSAWLMQTAKNKTIDIIRRERHKKKFAEENALLLKSEYTAAYTVENLFLPHEIKDSQLRMIFACCHPALDERDQIALTLKTCSGFSVDEIAVALISNPETVKKRIQRAKQYITEHHLHFEIPLGSELTNRLDIALHCIYLLFNEGYNSSHREELIRKDLCEEALRLALMLTENEITNQPKCSALIALMSLLSSRFNSRLDEHGEIVLLEDQDRSKWDGNLINFGLDYLSKASSGNELSEYHLEAAIVAEHTIASSFAETNWSRILEIYNLLMTVNASPMLLLNRAIVIGKIKGQQAALKEINSIPEIEKWMGTHYLFAAVVADLHSQAGNSVEAIDHFKKAIGLTSSLVEKKLLMQKMKMVKLM